MPLVISGDGEREIPGALGRRESAEFWVAVMTEQRNRGGVRDT